MILTPIFLVILVAARASLKVRVLQDKNSCLNIYKQYLHALNNAGYEFKLSDNTTMIATKVARKLNTVAGYDKKLAIKATWEVANSANLLLYSE